MPYCHLRQYAALRSGLYYINSTCARSIPNDYDGIGALPSNKNAVGRYRPIVRNACYGGYAIYLGLLSAGCVCARYVVIDAGGCGAGTIVGLGGRAAYAAAKPIVAVVKFTARA